MKKELLAASLLVLASVATEDRELENDIEDLSFKITDKLPRTAFNRFRDMGLTLESLSLVQGLIDAFRHDLESTSDDSAIKTYLETL